MYLKHEKNREQRAWLGKHDVYNALFSRVKCLWAHTVQASRSPAEPSPCSSLWSQTHHCSGNTYMPQ